MTPTLTLPSREPAAGAIGAADAASGLDLAANPFLHIGPDRIYDPLTDLTLVEGDPLHGWLQSVLSGSLSPAALPEADRGRLQREGWLVRREEDHSKRFLLKYVSLEAHTVCNQACYFCPVSIAPRAPHFMPTDLYERILDQLAAYRDTIEAVFMINYNEPTADRRFVDQVRAIRAVGLPPAVLTNGSGLTPKRVDALVEMGGLRFLSINLSTLDRERYARERGVDQVDLILRHLEYAKDKPLAEQMDIVVLGTGNEAHDRDFAEITARFAGSRFTAKRFEVMDRAGYLQIGLKPVFPRPQLCGCENIGSRPLQHLHITPEAKCVLCCEDYDNKYVVGDLSRESLDEVLTGPTMSLMRRWAYGLEEAPGDFLCNGCTFALTRAA